MRSQIISFLQKEIDNRVTPGAVIRIKHKGEWIIEEALGSNSLEDDKVPMTAEHLFDVASLTKVMATLPAILQLFQTGDIYLQDKVARFLPNFAQNDKGNITLQQLLTHSSGLIAHRPYFEKQLTYDEVLADIYKENLVYTPETKVVYSDLGYILLGAIIEKVTDQPLQDYVKNNIYKPLQMSHTTYLPSVERHQYAPTEYLPHLQDFKYGIVHDDNTEFMGGISGHAGLFSTIGDIAKFCDMLECNGEKDGKQFLHPLWIQKSRENFTSFSSEARGIGWQLKGNGTSPIGDLMSTQTYGHTGFTGTSFYIDPKSELIIILLTNRVYFGRQDEMVRLRPRLHNLIMTNLTS
ncbi:serine hydrolase domain-containing protein [Psychrobacillus sp. NPDC093180]|uniref:serine hydrolase domain-containing protein n=1 Tax=Psychrobacillus sp. NPDC093180 TaxID=3364489 RepID=UPI00381E6BCC